MKLSIALLLWVLAPAPAGAEADRAVLIGLGASVLKIEAQQMRGGFSLGSGVVVAPERVVTNCHVTRDASKIDVLRGGLRRPAEVEYSDVVHDLCVLRVPGLGAGAVALARTDQLQLGQPVTALGYTGGVGLRHSQGIVLGLHRFDGGRVIQSSNWFSSGASGGGLFDDDQRLVGILTFRLRGGEAHYFAAPVAWLRAMLDAPQQREADSPPERSPQLAYWERPLAEQPRFLRAALLQRDDQWPQLEALAAEWTRVDAGDPEPWTLLAMALTKLHRLPEAQQALACVIRSTTGGRTPCGATMQPIAPPTQ